MHTHFIELAGEINTNMPNWVVDKIADALNLKSKSINNSKILLLGVAYKKNVDDMRESPSVVIMSMLERKGAKLSYSDPHIPVLPALNGEASSLESVELSPEIVSSYDLVLLTTDHDKFDYHMIEENAALIVDTRGVFSSELEHVVKA